MTQVGLVLGVVYRTVRVTLTVMGMVFVYLHQIKEINRSVTVLRTGWEKLVSYLVSMASQLSTMNAFAIHVTVEMAAVCSAQTGVTLALMVHVTVDLRAGGEMRVRFKDVLDTIKTVRVMESVFFLQKPVFVIPDGKVRYCVIFPALTIN